MKKGTKGPLQKAGATQPMKTKKPPGWEALGAILYEDECTSFYLFVNEFIFAGESMGCGYRRGGRPGWLGREQPEREQRSKEARRRLEKDNAEAQSALRFAQRKAGI